MSQTMQQYPALVLAPLALVALVGTARAEEPMHTAVYGFLNAQVERTWALGGTTPYLPRSRVADGGSRIGFKGSYELRARTRALWQIEGALLGFDQGGISDQGSPIVITSRNTFVGLEHDCIGRLVLGHYDSPYRSLVGSGGAMGGNLGLTVLGLDLWNNTDAQLSGTSRNIFSRGEARYGSSASYYTPQWSLPLPFASSVQLAAAYSFDEVLATGADRGRYSIAGLLRFGGFSLGAAYDRQANTGIDVDNLEEGYGLATHPENGVSTQFYKVVASFLAPTNTYLGVGFERSRYGYVRFIPPTGTDYYARDVTGAVTQNGGMASLAQSIGGLSVMASAGVLWKLEDSIVGPGSDYRARQYSFGAKYAFGDRFGAYVFYTAIQNRARQDVNLGAPLYSNNLGTAQAYLARGNSPHAIGMGIITRF